MSLGHEMALLFVREICVCVCSPRQHWADLCIYRVIYIYREGGTSLCVAVL